MAVEVSDLERASAWVRSRAAEDTAALGRDELIELSQAVARLERVVGAWGARLAGEIDRLSAPEAPGGGLARQSGYGNAQKMLSTMRGTSQGAAKRSISAGRAHQPKVPVSERVGTPSAPPKPKHPHVAAASLAGDLSVEAAGLIVEGLERLAARIEATHLDTIEERLVKGAAGRSAHDVQRMVARAVARVDKEEHLARERKNYDERYLWWKTGHDGVVTIHGKLDVVTAAPIINVIEQMTTRSVRNQSRPGQGDGVADAGTGGAGSGGNVAGEGGPVASADSADAGESDTRSIGQMRADALHELARHALGCSGTRSTGVRTSMVVRVGLADLERGAGLGTIDGVEQPVSVQELRRLAGDAGFIPEVLAGDGEVLDLGRQVRAFTRAQRIALLERDGGCAKCHAPPEHCEAHHIRWWESGGRSDLANGVMLCTRCHHDIHRYGWDIDIVGGKVMFTPPPEVDPEGRYVLGGSAALDVPVPPDPVAEVRDDDAMIARWEAEFREWDAQFEAARS